MKKKIAAILAIAFVASIVFFLLYNKIEAVEITGCEYCTKEEIQSQVVAGFGKNNSVLMVLKYKLGKIKEIPYVEKLTIKRVSRNKIKIRVYEKSLVACVKYMGQYVYFDKDGIVLNTSGEQLADVPLLSGVDFSGFTLYKKLKVEDEDIFDEILDLSQVMRRFALSVDKIVFNTEQEVILTAGKVKLYLGKRQFYDEPVAALSQILPILEEKGLAGTIDMTECNSGDKVIFKESQEKKSKTNKNEK